MNSVGAYICFRLIADISADATITAMNSLSTHETELVGKWVERDGKVVADATCQRIDQLTNGGLNVVQDHPRLGGWVRLYQDKSDGRFWERSYPQSELHGGGPPTLRCISADEVVREYDFQPGKLPAQS